MAFFTVNIYTAIKVILRAVKELDIVLMCAGAP